MRFGRAEAAQFFICALGVGTLAACGGGGGGGGGSSSSAGTDAAGPCTRYVVTSTVTDPAIAYTDTGGAGGGGDSGGGGGDAGGGGAEGQFRNALFSVEQADGVFVGEATVDDTLGMVRFRVCGYDGPLKFTISGKRDGSTTYYDEGKETSIRFPAGETIRAIVPRLGKNVGVTPLTEAAYIYVTTKYGPDGWKTAANVDEANELVRTEFNRLLPAALQIEDITRLPWVVGEKTPPGIVPATKNGLYGIVNAGLARAASLFNVGDVQPALTLSRQIGRDLVDGKLDLFANDAPVLGEVPSAQAAYNAHQIRETVNTGVGQIAARLGNRETSGTVVPFTQLKFIDPTRSAFSTNPIAEAPMFLLRKDGAVYFWPRRDQPMQRYDTDYRQLYSSVDLLGSKRDGRVLRIPAVQAPANEIPRVIGTPVAAPQLFGATTIKALDPTLFAGSIMRLDGAAFRVFRDGSASPAFAGNVIDVGVSASGTSLAFFAARTDGRVVAWGDAICGQVGTAAFDPLGLGRTAANCAAITVPEIIPALAGIIAVTGHESGGFAIDRAQRVWGWGSAQTNGVITSVAPALVDAINRLGPILQLECATSWQCIALTPTGRMITWGLALTADGRPLTGTVAPTAITLPAGRRGIYVGTAGYLTFGLLDDGRIVLALGSPGAPRLIDTAQVPLVE